MADSPLPIELTKWMNKVKSCRRGTINGKRHPHQPAILLWFLTSASVEIPRTITWLEGKQMWKVAIRSHNGGGSPESPITALVNDNVLECSQPLSRTASSPSARVILNSSNPLIGLPEQIWTLIVSDPVAKSSAIDFITTQID